MSLAAPQFEHDLFEKLENLLTRISTQPTTSTIRRFSAQLEDAAPWISSLTRLPEPSEEDRQSLKKEGLTLQDGSNLKINGELLALTNNASSLLSVSHTLAASLVSQALQLRNHYVSRSILEISTYILHNFLTSMLSFLHELFRLTIGPGAEDSPPFDTFRERIQQLLTSRVALKSGEGSLVDLILEQVDALQRNLETLTQQRATGQEYDLLVYRVNATRVEQNKLAGLLSVIAQGGMLGRGHVIKILKWLKNCNRMDSVAGTIFAVFLCASTPIDHIPDNDPRYDMILDRCRDIKFLKIASNLVFVENWTLPRLREAAKLPWALFILSTLRQDPMAAQVGIDPPTADQFLYDGVNGEAFQGLRARILDIRRDRNLDVEDPVTSVDVLAHMASKSDSENDEFYLEQVQILIQLLAAKKNLVRNLRNREEDLAIRRSGTAPANYQSFLSLVASVYGTLPPDSAVTLWDDLSFIGTVLDQRGNSTPAFWDMLAAISRGKACSGRAHDRMSDSRWSWAGLSKFYQYYWDLLPHIFEPIKTNRTPSLELMGHDDIALCEGWTKLIIVIVQWSPLARTTLLQSKPNPLSILFDFMNCELPLDVKTAILKAITAFITPGEAEDAGKAVEFYERITYADPGLDTKHLEPNKIPAPIGWLAKMEYAEIEVGIYPLTTAYLDFLTTLLSAGSSPRLRATLRRSIYYVIDRVLLQARPLSRESERWDILDSAIALLEKAVLRFDMSSLSGRQLGPAAEALWEEPGFVVMLRLLSEPGPSNVLSHIVDTASITPRSPIMTSVLLRTLRMYHRILDTQLVFSEVLIRTLSDRHAFRRPLNLVSFDHILLTHLSNVNAIALLVGDDGSSVSFIATKLMLALASSRLFGESDRFLGEYAHPINRLAGIVDASDDSIRISQGFCNRLDADGSEVSPEELQSTSDAALRGDISPESIAHLPLAIRSTILDLLLENTSLDITGPNVAHFLLGYEFKGHDFVLQDPSDPNSRLSCLQVILDQMSGDPLVSIHPVLAAKSARLMHQLFSHPITSQTTISFASLKGYSTIQLASLPRKCPSALSLDEHGAGTVNGEATTSSTLEAFLELQRDVLSCVALETHTFGGRGSSSSAIANLLFNFIDDDYGQRPPLIIDLLGNIDIEWEEAGSNEDRPLEFYGSFDFQPYKRTDADWWDLEALRPALVAHRRNLEKRGAIGGSKGMEEEADHLLSRLAALNRKTDINLAKGSFLTAWSETLKVALGQLFSHISDDRQEVVLIELLDALLDRLSGDVSPGVLDILAESLLISMSRLVEVMAEYEGVNLPVKQLSPSFARLVQVVSRPGMTESCRGNLYAAMNQYLSLQLPSTSDDGASVVSSATTLLPGTEFHQTNLVIITAHRERLFPVLCRDAMDVRDVWKTECFALLGVIVAACRNDRERQAISPLSQNGFLSSFVRSLKDQEIPLQECLNKDADSLHAYWVYESKITFLLAYASTRKGAEDLLDAGLFEVLAMCNFFAVEMINEETTAKDSEAITRQHRVVIAALQLVARTLSSLHRSARSGAGHAISFLYAHRNAILFLLRENQQNIHLLGIEECRLIISLLALVYHKVPEDAKRSDTGFGLFHSATLAVAARFFNPESWQKNLADDSDQGVQEGAPKSLKRTVDAIAQPQVLNLNQVILSYLVTATGGLKGQSGYPVLVNAGIRTDQNKYTASAPSMDTLIEMLSDLAEATEDISAEYQTIIELLDDGGSLDDRVIERLSGAGLLNGPWTEDSLPLALTSQTRILFNMIESILLLLWRHLLFYANDARSTTDAVRADNLAISLSGSLTSGLEGSRLAQGMIQSLVRSAASLRGVLDRLSEIDVQPELRKGKSEDAYFGMLMRRLKELTSGLMAA
ncbi:nucleoporin Nup186/Nup192/Nup205 [Kockovaella imperatae]|uniref:Nucleoporin Nup186/Nup192/Nup205 n=1 Tax=Kockovaella imperatae TaxID=4999 RepID=A0A1Y1UAB1_9TREE|nr:nucleoporin Nup186/Nup192/Nup205 [Kockovaella imperatae]ORX34973.1 nucleoporin Nup186/Nup192/Nup205 [Kockovaella imperatae]